MHAVDDLSTGSRDNVAAGAELHELDVRSSLRELFEDVRPELCFHLAAQADVGTSVAQPSFDAEVNVVGTVRILEAAHAVGARVVFTSTGGAIYGEREEPADEDAPRLPASPYAASKLAGEEYLAMWNRLHGTSHVVCRLANVYGPRQLPTLEGGVVAIFLDRLKTGQENVIFGDGLQTRDFVYVGDVAAALLASVEGSGVYNVGSGKATRIADLHRLCAETAGAEQEPSFAEPRPGDLRHSVLDFGRAERELGWRPETSLAAGLSEIWAGG